MPTPPHGRHLRLETLEDRRLLSAGDEPPAAPAPQAVPPESIVVTGTDANDVITLTRIDQFRVEVTIRSFLDPDYTRPTDDPVVQYEVHPNFGFMVRGCNPDYAVTCDVVPVTGNIRVEGGAGTDRVEVIDLVGRPFVVRGTYRTEEPADGQPDRRANAWLRNGDDGRWAFVTDADGDSGTPLSSATLTEGVDMVAGAAVGIRFQTDYPPLDLLPLPVEPGDNGPTATEPALTDQFVGDLPSADGLVLAIAWLDEGEAAGGFEGQWDGAPAPGSGSDPSGLSDLWVEWANDLAGDASDWGMDAGAAGSDWFTGDGPDDWMTTNLEN